MSEVELVRDEQGGVTVMVDGQPQSHVDVDDPEGLAFEYVQHLAAAIDALTEGTITITHVGGAGLTLARWVEHTRPGSPQIVLEPDAALTEIVRRELPLPRRHRIRVRPVDGRSGVAALRDDSADVVVVDAFAGGQVPSELTTREFFGEVARVLTAQGVLLVNAPDEPGLKHVGRVLAGIREVLPEVTLVATTEVLKGRRFGNTILVGSRRPVDTDEIARQVRRWPFPSGVLGARELTRRFSGSRSLTDADPAPSPVAPELGAWRLR